MNYLNQKGGDKQKVDGLPFYSVKCTLFEDMVLNLCVQDENHTSNNREIKTIPFSLFKDSFEDMPDWGGHFDQGTPLMVILQEAYFEPYASETPHELEDRDLSVDRLILMGILLCKGKARERAEVLWRLVQTHEQEHIAATDKDFYPVF